MNLDVSRSVSAGHIAKNPNWAEFQKNEQSFTHKREHASKDDIYSKYPVRLLGFTNEVGAAVSPLIGPVGELISYAPALSYIFMDVKDKYKRGENGNYESPSKKKAVEQLTFQTFASVILPTATVKTAQALANKIIDAPQMSNVKKSFDGFINKNLKLKNFVNKFADKAEDAVPKKAITKFAIGFQKALNVITVFPMFFKNAPNKSGARNIALTAIGLTALAAAIKPLDKFTERIIIDKGVKPLLNKDKKE